MQNLWRLPTKAEAAKAIREFGKKVNPDQKINPNPIIFEDPLFTQPLLKTPIKWISVRGEYSIKATIEEDEPIVEFICYAPNTRGNGIRIAFENFPDMQKFLDSVHVHKELETDKSSFKITANKNALIKTVGAIGIVGTILTLIKKFRK